MNRNDPFDRGIGGGSDGEGACDPAGAATLTAHAPAHTVNMAARLAASKRPGYE